jgi:Alpha/beta hydrolase family
MDFVLAHGTGQGPSGWDRLVDVLEQRDHRAYAADFPVDQPDLLAEDYAPIAASQVGQSVRDPVVVAHSGSGLLQPAVAGAVAASHLVWVAAAIPDFVGGSSFADLIAGSGPEIASDDWRTYGRDSVDDPVLGAYFGFHDDCDVETMRWGLATVRFTSGTDELLAPAGSLVTAPIGEPHTFGNADTEAPASLLCTVVPERYLGYFRDLQSLRPGPDGMLVPAEVVEVMARYATEPYRP